MKNKLVVAFLGLFAPFSALSFAQTTLNPVPARLFGQHAAPKSQAELASPTAQAPNMVEGREFYLPQGVALDRSADPPILYVADGGNNRVLAWKNPAAFTNGAPADLVLGQKDFFSSAAVSLSSFSSALFSPTSVAVDSAGNVFVADSGNNRILRFPVPFAQEAEVKTADLVIGQPNLTSRNANRGSVANTLPTESTIRTNGSNTGGIQMASLVFDADGNLWFSDSGNHRILRYPAQAVSGGSSTDGAIAADYVLGQLDFATATPNPARLSTPTDRIDKRAIRFGGPLAFDASGNLFFADDLGRVLMWKPGFDSSNRGKPADRILGIYVQAPNTPLLQNVNDVTFGANASQTTFAGGPQGLFCVGDYLFVSDTLNNRIVRYDPPSTWTPENLAAYSFSPKMAAVYGQPDFHSRESNMYRTFEPNAGTVSAPLGAVYANGEIYLVDSGNHRVLALPFLPESNLIAPARAVLGQVDFTFRSPNLIEGREFSSGTLPLVVNNTVSGLTLGPASAVDKRSDPPHLFIADTGNNRILGFYDQRRMKAGDTADLVLGQVDVYRALINSPTNDSSKATPTGLLLPASVAVDAEGNVWVADTGNGRVLRFPRPFDHWGEIQAADIVIGQPDFETRGDGTAGRDRLFRPSSLAFTGDGHLVVSDLAHNRVLLFVAPFSNGMAAAIILGQPDESSTASGATETNLNLPLGVALDSDDRLYVADTGNRRLAIFDRVTTQPDGGAAALIIPNITPLSVNVSAYSGQVWVAANSGNRVMRFPRFDQMLFSGNPAADYSFVTYAPRHVALDDADNIIVADSAHRLTLHFPLHAVYNGANKFPRVAPVMRAYLEAPGVNFAPERTDSASVPLPMELADLEVLVDGLPSPMLRVDGSTLRFIVPKNAPTTGAAEFIVRRVSTGQILAHNRVAMSVASPGILFAGENPSIQAQARALNQDGTQNTSGNPVNSNQELTIFLTGCGNVDGTPEDGQAPGSDVPMLDLSVVGLLVTTSTGYQATVLSSTLDPNEPGVWRLKIKVPQVVQDGTYGLSVAYRSIPATFVTVGTTTTRVNPLVTVKR